MKSQAQPSKLSSNTQSTAQRLASLVRENKEHKRPNDIQRQPASFLPKRSSTETKVIVDYIDACREHYSVELICKELPIAPSTYYSHKQIRREPERLTNCKKRDAE